MCWSASERIMLKQSFEVMERYGVQAHRALHIGAHEGLEDGEYGAVGIEPVYVEANPTVFARLVKRLPGRRAVNVAISDMSGVASLHITSMDQSSSILPLKEHKKVYRKIVEVDQIEVPCTTIDQLCGEMDIDFDMLAMDIQGAELMAIRGGGELIPRLKTILTEVNRREMYEGCPLIGDMDAALGEYGFVRVASWFEWHPSWGDALYLRKEDVARVPAMRRWAWGLRAWLGRKKHKKRKRWFIAWR